MVTPFSEGYKLLLGRFPLDSRGKLCTRTISHWNNLPRAVVEPPALDMVKIPLGQLVWMGLCQGRLGQLVPESLPTWDAEP